MKWAAIIDAVIILVYISLAFDYDRTHKKG
jgi:hypothetical protein